ncbi:MAG: PKD domain-containing protein [Saprospiraceae bacterium]|nr:PKD domain-containing protein [Saprospiraceae bacterium]
MKVIFFAIVGLLLPLHLFSQLHDNTWILGYPALGGYDPTLGHSILTFTDGSLQIDSSSVMNDMEFPQNNSAFSDENGELFAFFNGLHIRNKTFVQDVENGGDMHEEIDFASGYYLSFDFLVQGSVFLRYPGHEDSLILLYMSNRYLLNNNNFVTDRVSFDVTAALIDMKGNNELGKVVNRKIPVVHDTLTLGKLHTVRHANGRDWWVLAFQRNSSLYYRILIDPSGIHNLGLSEVEKIIRNGAGSSVFSPDGQRYAAYSAFSFDTIGSHLDIFDFDRCTGYLTNQIRIEGKGDYGGVAISPNSRYLYNNKRDTAFQYDLHAADIPASRKVVAVYDGFTDPFQVTFYMMQLAPDGKIYSSATNGTRYLHVIHRPDEEGMDCQYQQRGIQLYKYNDFSVPNFPNYRLGPLDGSPCDTLGLNNHPKAWYRYEQDTLDALAVAFTDLSYYEPASWSWDFGDGSAGSTERHPTHQFPKPDVYQVRLTVSNQYGSDTHCKTLYLGVSATSDPARQTAQVLLWPNPTDGRLQLYLPGMEAEQEVRLRVADISGRTMLERSLATADGNLALDASRLAPGVYFCLVSTAGQTFQPVKFVISR